MTENEQELIRAWVKRILEAKDWSIYRLAQEAGLADSTVRRIFEARKYTTSTTTISKIVRASGIAAPTGIGGLTAGETPGFAEPEAAYIGPASTISENLRAGDTAPAGEHAAVWRLDTDLLALAGYRRGDLLMVDPDTVPRDGDVVCVQLYDRASGEAETVFRVYHPPYLVTAATSQAAQARPMLRDEGNAVWGTVVRTVRERTP